MSYNISTQIASILGPVLMVISSSEFVNFKIWEKVNPTVVYLNGLILFIGGLAIIRFHNIYTDQWMLVITILGWLIFIAGIYRMFFPTKQQAQKGWQTNILLLILFLSGCYLTYKAYM
jgi:multisubunit Na+/H+ antiporter MnhG subunit